jgi:dipeptidase D
MKRAGRTRGPQGGLPAWGATRGATGAIGLSLCLVALSCGDQARDPGDRASAGAVAVAGGMFCNDQCVVDTFKQLAPLYRPSGEEKALSDRLVQLATEANDSRWSTATGKLEILTPDAVGNFVIRVPATGRFAREGLPPVALQAHMDMVLAATDVPPGGDLKAYFREHPVEIEVKDGKIQSVGQKTTLGADNTVGCALMLRYALDPTIEHPPLELVFTVHEEVGLKGAQEYDTAALPLRAPVMISLDGFDSDKLIHGSQGSVRRSVTGALAAQPVPAGKLVKVTVSKLLGGHSGADIHRQRLNAVIALAAIGKVVLAQDAVALVSATAGDLAGLNKIPTDLELVLSAPAALEVSAFRSATEATVRGIVGSHLGEAANAAVAVAVAELPADAAGSTTALTGEAAGRLIDTVLATEQSDPPLNGVVTKKAGYPNDVNTSSNLGVLELKPTADMASRRNATVGFMTRSFSIEELGSTARRLIEHLGGAFAEPQAVQVREIAGYDPWLEDPDSWLVRLGVELEVKGRRPFRTVGVQAVGLEPSYFMTKFPGLQLVGMGATIAEAHTVHETVTVQSILDMAATLDAFLARLAAADPFRNAPPRP